MAPNVIRVLRTNNNTASDAICSWVAEGTGQSVVLTSTSLSSNSICLYGIDYKGRPQADVSIVICTYGRPESLNETLTSLSQQTYRDFEVLLITEKGNLAELRQKGLVSSLGRICSFIDDDVYCPPTWLQGVVDSFREGILGATGPTTITDEYKSNRDCFKYKRLRSLQEWLFDVPHEPGRLSVCGAPSMASNDGTKYEGEVQYLECCNMSVLREDAVNVGGFDRTYGRTSEWCEVDLSLKLGLQGRLYFSQAACLHHRPSRQGVYSARLSTRHRWDNFKQFQRRWVKPSFRRVAYWAFIWTYFKAKQMRMI